MKKSILSISILSVFLLGFVRCTPNHGNKDILPLDTDMDGGVHTTDDAKEHVFDQQPENDTVVVDATTAGELDENGNYIYNVGESVEITLPGGIVLNVGENSTENKLYQFLSDNNFEVSEDKSQGWITLDRVYFNTGNSELTPSSHQQLDNIVALMTAYPNAQVKLGGYTDNSGSQEVNQPLSQKRAESVKAMIEEHGIAADRVAAEGYGSEHPICPANDTKECMAKNRRVDIRLVKK